jgi:hypothetical protein
MMQAVELLPNDQEAKVLKGDPYVRKHLRPGSPSASRVTGFGPDPVLVPNPVMLIS